MKTKLESLRYFGRLVFLTLFLCVATHISYAQLSIAAVGTPAVHTFDLGGTSNCTANLSWVNNVTIPHCYSDRGTYNYSNGCANTGGLHVAGTGGETALGGRASNSTTLVRWGVRLKNNTGQTLTSLQISLRVEQWGLAQTNLSSNTVQFAYRISSSPITDVTSGSYTNNSTWNLTSFTPAGSCGGGNSAIDGNSSAYSALLQGCLNVTLNPGDEIMLRWNETNDACNDHMLCIDDLSVTGFAAPVIAGGTTASFCEGQSLQISASGAQNYLWNTGETTSSITVTTPGTYTVSTTHACGTQSASQTVTVNPLPTAAITSAGGITAICAGTPLTLTASGGDTYLWNNGETTASITVSTAGTYHVTVSNSCGTDNASIEIDALPFPDAQITADGPLDICAGQSLTLTASGGDTYLWNTGEITTSITVSNSGEYILTATNGCGDDKDTIAVNVVDLPTAVITPSGALTICAGDNLVLTASGGDSYLWNTGETTAAIQANASGTYTVTVTAQCGTDQTSVQVTVNPLPVATITASGPLTLCAGSSVTLTASGGDSYLWNTGETNASITVNHAGTFIVTATNACGTDTESVTVSVLALPVAAVQVSGTQPLCPGETAILLASGGQNYVWNTGQTGASITVSSAGVYTVTASDNCGSDQASVTITASDLVAAFIPSVTSGQAPLEVSFLNQSIQAQTYSWEIDNTVTTVDSPDYTFTEPGTYPVVLTAQGTGGCVDTAIVYINVLPELSAMVVPNVFTPNGDGVNDLFLVGYEGIVNFHCTIFNRWGSEVVRITDIDAGWDGRVGGSPVQDGVYYYVISAEGHEGKKYELSGHVTLVR